MNINTQGLSPNTVSITDYKIVGTQLAKVIIAFTGRQSTEELSASICAQLKHLAAPVETSFRIVKDGVAVGFVRATREVRPIEEQELRASYRVVSSNIMMDNKDKTMWEVKKSSAGMYLARQGHEDLSELVNASVNPRTGVPRLHHLSMATAAAHEFVAFASESGDMDYGFCVGTSKDKSKLRIVSSTTNSPIVISTEVVASVCNVPVPKEAHKAITAAGLDREDTAKSIAYYEKLYGYSPEYLAEVVKQVEDTARM